MDLPCNEKNILLNISIDKKLEETVSTPMFKFCELNIKKNHAGKKN